MGEDTVPELHMGEKTLFTTSSPEGVMIDVFIVECFKMNDENFRGTVTHETCFTQ